MITITSGLLQQTERRDTKISNTNKIVFLVGKQRTGKDTVADLLVQHFGFTKMSLADKVKEVARDLFDMKGKDRGLLIQIGTKMREIQEDVWLEYLLNKTHPKTPIVIPDVRFPNEFKTLKDMGAISVRVDASVDVRKFREGYDEEFENDTTEEALVNHETDFTILNEGTLTQLFMTVYHLGETILE